MSEYPLHTMPLAAAADAIAAGTLTARALADDELARVAATDAAIEAWAHLDPDHVRMEADRCDAAPRADRGPLHGVGVGVKDIVATVDQPTKDAIPFSGVHLFSETLDQLGTFTRSVADAARLASALADAGRIAPVPALPGKPPRFAYLDGFPWTQEVDCDADDTLDAAATRLRQHGAEVVALGFPARWREAHLVHRAIMLYEAASHLCTLQDRERARLSPKLNAALDEGRGIRRADYDAALAHRSAAIAYFTAWLADYDAIIAPPAPGPAPAGLASTGDPSCCTLWSLTGFPALSLPIGCAANGLPLGMQLATPAGADDRLLAVAAWCEARLAFKGLVLKAPAGGH
jgi:Asp-tRNA(Asn)/Glu-tRNA(Gln) amidotransferase A subunit family amidase